MQTTLPVPVSTRRQRGAATIISSISLSTLINLVTLYSSRTVRLEQQLSNNDVRPKHAFEAAEAGLAAAVDFLTNEEFDADDNGAVDLMYDANADGTTDSNSKALDTGSYTVS